MTSTFKNLLVLLLCILLMGLLSGCELIPAAIYYRNEPPIAPMVKASTEDSITVKYRGVGPDVKHDEVKQMIIDHCGGPYIETHRKKLSGWITIEAECAHRTDS